QDCDHQYGRHQDGRSQHRQYRKHLCSHPSRQCPLTCKASVCSSPLQNSKPATADFKTGHRGRKQASIPTSMGTDQEYGTFPERMRAGGYGSVGDKIWLLRSMQTHGVKCSTATLGLKSVHRLRPFFSGPAMPPKMTAKR